jgi:hypothetical protein
MDVEEARDEDMIQTQKSAPVREVTPKSSAKKKKKKRKKNKKG